MTPRCNGRCHSTAPHGSHLFVGPDQYAMRVDRDGVYVFMPDGTSLWRAKPEAIQALKFDVRSYLERLRSIEAAEDAVDWKAKERSIERAQERTLA